MPSQNEDARHKALVLCAPVPLLMFADGAAGAGHRAPLRLLSLASQGFSLCHSWSFHHGLVGSCRWWGWHEPYSPMCVTALVCHFWGLPQIFHSPVPAQSWEGDRHCGTRVP